jgi:hypothetical protein
MTNATPAEVAAAAASEPATTATSAHFGQATIC